MLTSEIFIAKCETTNKNGDMGLMNNGSKIDPNEKKGAVVLLVRKYKFHCCLVARLRLSVCNPMDYRNVNCVTVFKPKECSDFKYIKFGSVEEN